MEGKAWIAARKDVKTYPQMAVFGDWFQDYPDPQNWLSVYWKCGTFAARLGYCNEQLDELVKKGDTELDPAKRYQFYEQAGQMLIDDVPGPFLYNAANVFLVKSSVTGFIANPGNRSGLASAFRSWRSISPVKAFPVPVSGAIAHRFPDCGSRKRTAACLTAGG